MLGDLAKILAAKGIALTYSDDAVNMIAERSFSTKYGARNMRRFIQREIEDPLAEEIIKDHGRSLSHADISVSDGKFAVKAD